MEVSRFDETPDRRLPMGTFQYELNWHHNNRLGITTKLTLFQTSRERDG